MCDTEVQLTEDINTTKVVENLKTNEKQIFEFFRVISIFKLHMNSGLILKNIFKILKILRFYNLQYIIHLI